METGTASGFYILWGSKGSSGTNEIAQEVGKMTVTVCCFSP